MDLTPLRPLYGPREIHRTVRRLAGEIDRDHAGETVTFVCALKGSFIFAADLVRALRAPVIVDFIHLASYRSGTSPGTLRLLKDLEEPLRGRRVVMVEDIVDTGRTAAFLLRHLGRRGPLSCRLCALLDKPSRRAVKVPVDYRGFQVPDRFIVGYGLDWNERYRQLPGLYVLEKREHPPGPDQLPSS